MYYALLCFWALVCIIGYVLIGIGLEMLYHPLVYVYIGVMVVWIGGRRGSATLSWIKKHREAKEE